MFRLRRYFSVAGGVAILAMALLLAFAYRASEFNEHTNMAGLRNEILARAFANAIWPEFGAEITNTQGFDRESLKSRPVAQRVNERLRAMTAGVPIIKIKIYSPSGLAVFSSVRNEIGEDKSQNPAFNSARQGNLVNELTHRGTMSASEGEIENVDVVSSYIPIRRSADGQVDAVFELYTDVTHFIAKIERYTTWISLALIAVFSLLYVTLLVIVGRADKIINKQYADLKDSEDRIRQKNTDLEREVGERKNAEAALRRSEQEAAAASRAKSDFLSSMSHELRTPMNAILGFAQLLPLERDSPLSANQQKFVEQILKAGDHLLQLINQVLDLSRIEAGKLDISLEAVRIGDVVQECLSLVGDAAKRRGIALSRLQPVGDEPTVLADHIRLKQVLLNLLSNAVKYNRDGGNVSVHSQLRPDGNVRISVSDTGRGIPAERQSELFSPFSRLGVASTDVEGTGIGLNLSRRLVELMGGEIGFSSVDGEGSIFWVDLPAAASPAEVPDPAPVAAAPDTADDSRPRTILYVEDNPANLMLMEEIVRRIPGAALLSAHNAELGLELAGARRPDLIIMDINLPGMSGIEALRHLKREPATAAIPVIALTASASEKDVQRGMDAGFQHYETKPIIVSRLLAVIEGFLRPELEHAQ